MVAKYNKRRIIECERAEVVDVLKILNQRSLETINAEVETDSEVSKKLIRDGYVFKTSTEMMILGDIVYEGLKPEITIKDNMKTTGIMGIAFPNIQQQTHFMSAIKRYNNSKLLNDDCVEMLWNYFKEHKLCFNSGVCNGICYNNKDNYMRKNKNANEFGNLLAYLVDREKFIEDMVLYTKPYSLFRINLNGEIHTREMLDTWVQIAKKSKRTTFYTYTKSYELFNDYLAEGNKLPNNLIVNISLVDGTEKEFDDKFPLLADMNKFLITSDNLIEKEKTVCGGKCITCEGELCYTKKKNRKIYCAYHN